VTRYVIDALTLVHLVDHDLRVDPAHQLVAPNRIRSEALELLPRDAEYLSVTRLQADALVTVDAELAAKADGIVPVTPVASLLSAPSG
jgi:hypothetical protein